MGEFMNFNGQQAEEVKKYLKNVSIYTKIIDTYKDGLKDYKAMFKKRQVISKEELAFVNKAFSHLISQNPVDLEVLISYKEDVQGLLSKLSITQEEVTGFKAIQTEEEE